MQNSAMAWIIGVVIVVLVAIGVWWYVGAAPTNPVTQLSPVATSTTSTPSSGVAVSTESRPSSSVSAVIASISDASSFNSYLVSTGVAASLTGKGPYTVFVPTNASVAALPAGTISNLTSDQKKRLVQYHVVSGKQLDIDAVSSGQYTALSKDVLNFQVNLTYQEAFVNSGYAIREYKASNGIVYLISAVLIPPQAGGSTTGSTGTPHP